MYAVANILKTDGTIYDRMLYFNNFTFYADKPCSILTDSYSIVDVPYVNEGTCECLNAGALALDGEIGYCLESDTKDENKDEASVLLRTLDINSESFKRFAPKAGAGVYTNMGHGNGMTYYDGALYVAAYIREDLKNNIAAMQHIVKLSAEGNVLGEYELDKGSCIGSIAHYRDNLFILGEYNHLGRTDNSGELTYAFEPMFYIGYFQNNRFIKTRTFSVTNPTFSLEIPPEKESASNVLQDIHYDDEFGLYYVTYTNGVSHMFRISPERVESAGIEVTEPMEPDEQFEFGTAFGEVESLSISALVHAPGAMYVAGKKGGNKVHRVTGTKFYRADLA